MTLLYFILACSGSALLGFLLGSRVGFDLGILHERESPRGW